MESLAEMGWIKNDNYTTYKPELSYYRPNQGFLIKPFEMYIQPGVMGEIPKRIIKNPITPVNIIKYEGEYAYVSSGFNGLAFYVKGSDLTCVVTPKIINKLMNESIDTDTLAKSIREDILNWDTVKLHVLDIPDKSITLTKDQRRNLASKLTKITKIEKFDGAVLPTREALYPFYNLEFVDPEKSNYMENSKYKASFARYSFAVTGDDTLTVSLGEHLQSQYSVPVKFIKVNKEFIDYLKNILPINKEIEKNSINYLLNAKQVTVFYPNNTEPDKKSVPVEGKSQQQVNKCVRTVMNYVDTSSISMKADPDAKYVGDFEFNFANGEAMRLVLTDKYVRYAEMRDGLEIDLGYYKYNESLTKEKISPENILSGLFAAYF